MFRTYAITVTTWQDIIDIRGRMTVGELAEDGTPQLATRQAWTPANLDMRITGCSHPQTLTMQEYVATVGHMACCAARHNWDDMITLLSPCTIQAQVINHPARSPRNGA